MRLSACCLLRAEIEREAIIYLTEMKSMKIYLSMYVRTQRSSSQITLTGEQINEELFEDNMQLLPFAISPLGLFGPTINYFLYDTPPPKDYRILHNIGKSKFPNASNMARQAFTKTPSNILGQEDSIWKSNQRNYHYGGSYKSPDPSTYHTKKYSGERFVKQTAQQD